jgi:hypothetical protein
LNKDKGNLDSQVLDYQIDSTTKQGLQQLLNQYKSIRAISRAINVPKSTLTDRINKFNLKSQYDSHNQQKQIKGNIVFNDRNETPDQTDIEDLINKTIALQCSLDNLSTKQTKLSLNIQDYKPIAIGFWGDWHLGSKGCDYIQWRKDIETISNLDGFYYIGMGDYCNLALETHKGENYDELLNPSQQLQMAKYGLNKTKNQALGLIRGCHPDRLQKETDTDINEDFCKEADCANLWHGAEIDLTVGEINYKLRVRHKAPSESPINTTNAQRKQCEVHGEADVVALAHLHYPDVQQKPFQGKDNVVFIRSGSYKVWDEFGQKLNGYKGTYGISMIILYPNEKKIVPFMDFESGIKFLNSERN